MPECQLITKEEQLEVGQFYWLKSKTFENSTPFASQLVKKYENAADFFEFKGCNMWVPQAMTKYHIMGPIPVPTEWPQ